MRAILRLCLTISFLVLPVGLLAEDHARPRILDSNYELVKVVNDTPVPGCNGAVIGIDGALYVTHAPGCSVSRIDLATLDVAPYIPAHSGASFPDDITADESGNLFITGTTPLVGEVYRVDRDRKITVIASGMKAPNGIQYNRQTGRLFVTECFWGNRVLEIDRTGRKNPRLLVPENVISIPEGFDFDRITHDLIVPDMKTGRILRVHPDKGTVQTITDGFSQPVALKVGADNVAYIAEIESGSVYRLNLDGTGKEQLARVIPGIDNLAITEDNRLFVTSFWDATIFEVATDGSGRYKAVFPRGPIQPCGIVVKNDKLLISDVVTVRAVEGGKYGTTKLNSWLRKSMPAALALSDGPGEEIFWADLVDGAVAVGNPRTGEFRRVADGFNKPVALLADLPAQAVFVAESGAGQITKVNVVDGSRQVIARGMSGPAALTQIGARLYVAESDVGRISQLDLKTGRIDSFLTGLGKPCAIDKDAQGNLLVMDGSSHRLVRIAIPERTIEVVAENLPITYRRLGNQTATIVLPTPMAVDSQGNISIATASRGVITLRKTGK